MSEPTGELGWFRAELARSLVRPRAFAASLPREHYGLAGLVVTFAAGALLSLAVDSLVLAARGFAVLDSVPRLVVDAFFLAMRVTVTAAVLAALGAAALRLLRRLRPATRDVTMDQWFTAIAFALAPLLLVPPLAVMLALLPETAPLVGAAAAVLVARVFVGLTLHLNALIGAPLSVAALVLVLAIGAVGLADQVSRVRMVVYTYAPGLAAPLAAGSATGRLHVGDTYSLTVPDRWLNATGGVPGEAARFETDTDRLVVRRVRGSAFLTADSYADSVAVAERRFMERVETERRIARSGDLVLVDDIARGTLDGRPILLRQFTATKGPQIMALSFRYIEPADEAAALAESESIAATWSLR